MAAAARLPLPLPLPPIDALSMLAAALVDLTVEYPCACVTKCSKLTRAWLPPALVDCK
jgi:hypothetical protein